MLLDTETRNVTSHGLMSVARAQVKASPKIFNFFANQTYANKPKAICRELVANAWDSHTMAGKTDTPVTVWLPTLLDPTFAVRDEGLGMDKLFLFGDPDKGIPSQFMTYADGSTKDGSNEAIGGFGIGSKSPFSYVDQYTVVSRYDGVEYVGVIFKDDEGFPAIGLLGERPTDKPNGCEFSFPVKEEDFSTFEKAAFEALRYFDPLPNIVNASPGKEFAPPRYVAKGTTWAMREQAGDLAVIMGGIRYPVDTNNLTYKFPDDSPARVLLKYGLDVKLPIGACSIALSREALSYDDRTIEAIKTVCESVVDEVAASFAVMFDHIPAERGWEARVALRKEIGPSSYTDRAKFLTDHAKWHGEEFSVDMPWPRLGKQHEFGQSAGYEYWRIDSVAERRGRRGKIRQVGSAKWEYPNDHGTITPGRVAYLIIDDLPQAPKHKAIKKIKEFASEVDALEERVIVIRPFEGGDLTVAQILEGFGNPPADIVVRTSELPEPVMERKPRVKTDRPKIRMFEFDGSQQPNRWGTKSPPSNLNPGAYGRPGLYEVPYASQPDGGILVVMDKFDLPAGLVQKMNFGLLQWQELRFVNAGDAKKLKKANWTAWDVEFEKRKKVALAAYPELPQRLAVYRSMELEDLFRFFRDNPSLPELPPRSPLGRIRALYRQYVQTLTDDQLRLAALVEAKLPARVKPAELRKQFNTKQWKAKRLLGLLGTSLDDEDMKLLMENL